MEQNAEPDGVDRLSALPTELYHWAALLPREDQKNLRLACTATKQGVDPMVDRIHVRLRSARQQPPLPLPWPSLRKLTLSGHTRSAATLVTRNILALNAPQLTSLEVDLSIVNSIYDPRPWICPQEPDVPSLAQRCPLLQHLSLPVGVEGSEEALSDSDFDSGSDSDSEAAASREKAAQRVQELLTSLPPTLQSLELVDEQPDVDTETVSHFPYDEEQGIPVWSLRASGHLNGLTQLVLHGFRWTEADLQPRSGQQQPAAALDPLLPLPQLLILELVPYNNDIEDIVLATALAGLPSLTHLDIAGGTLCRSSPGCLAAAFQGLPNLQHLSFGSLVMELTGPEWASLAALPNLLHLQACRLTDVSDDAGAGPVGQPSFPRLESFSLGTTDSQRMMLDEEYAPPSTEMVLRALRDMQQAGQLCSLKLLCCQVSPDSLQAIAGLTALTELCIVFENVILIDGLTDSDLGPVLPQFASSLQQLQKLVLHGLRNVGDADLLAMAGVPGAFPQLRELSITRDRGSVGKGVLLPLASLPSMRLLRLDVPWRAEGRLRKAGLRNVRLEYPLLDPDEV